MKESGMGKPVRPPGPRLQALLDEGLRAVTVEVDYFAIRFGPRTVRA